MKDKSKLIAVGLVILTIIVIIVSLITNKKSETVGEINIVKNYSNFYTVNSCLYRTITYAGEQDKESLLLLLNDKYKKENKINQENVLTLFSGIETDSTFVSEKMYYQNLSENVVKYYVKGRIEKNQIYDDSYIEKEDFKQMYFIVYLDTSKKVFSIEPYSGDLFLGGETK